MQSKRDEFYRAKDLAELLKVNQSTIWRWVQSGRLSPPIKISPGCTRFTDAHIRELSR